MYIPQLYFASPRRLPQPSVLSGRVVVLDIAFAASIGDVSFEHTTAPFINGLGDRLALWIDHHDHDMHAEYKNDPRFCLATKQEHGACPEMINAVMVKSIGKIDTIVTHVDFDGLYAATKWILGGHEPYDGADQDAYWVDTRTGVPSAKGDWIDRALRARFQDLDLKHAIIAWLIAPETSHKERMMIDDAAKQFDIRYQGTQELSKQFNVEENIAFISVDHISIRYDKTELLLEGQKLAAISVVEDSGSITVAAPFNSGWDFVKLFGLEGGMPTRVNIPASRWDEVRSLLCNKIK